MTKAKSKLPERPRAGGSYTRNPTTGRLTRTAFTKDAADAASEKAAEAAETSARDEAADKPGQSGDSQPGAAGNSKES